MDINIIEDKKESLVFEIPTANHGFCNALKEKLIQDKDVTLATYRIDHPLVGIPRVKVEGSDPKASVKKAVKALKSDIEAFKKEVAKLK